MSKIDDILKAGATRTEKYSLGDIELTLTEMSWSDQEKWLKIQEEAKDDTKVLYASLICLCCKELKSCDPKQLIENWSPQVLIEVGTKALNINTIEESEKK